MNKIFFIIIILAAATALFLGICWLVQQGLYFVVPSAEGAVGYWQVVVAMMVLNLVISGAVRRGRS